MLLSTPPTLQITLKLQYLISHAKTSLFVAHKEYSSLTDQIRAKYEQLDSGEFGSPGTPSFDAEACELANLLACVSQLCQRLNLPMPKNCTDPRSSSIEDIFRIKTQAGSLGYGMEDAALFP